MKIKRIIKTIVLLTIFGLSFSNISYGQIDCPEGGGEWSSKTESYSFGQYGGGGEVNVQYRESGGNYEMKIDWNSLVNNDDVVSDEVLKKILQERAALSMDNTQGPKIFVVKVFYIRECKATVKLVIELNRGYEIVCCDVGVSSYWYEHYDGQEWHSLKNITKEVTCDYKCCERAYYCERVWDEDNEEWRTNIYSMHTWTEKACDPTSPYTDCVTGEPIPCKGGLCRDE